MTINPKARFQENTPFVNAHIETVDRDDVRRSLEVALAQMQMEQPDPPDLAGAAMLHNQMVGARRFIAVWMSLSEKTKSPERQVLGELKSHDAPAATGPKILGAKPSTIKPAPKPSTP